MELSIICVNWNSVDYLSECLASVYENTSGVEFEVIVVDNASPDNNVDTLLEDFPKIAIIKSQKNLGFAGANNLGFRHSSGDYVLFLNPDTKLIGPSIEILLKHAKARSDAGIVGCKLLNTDLTVQLSSIQRFPTILNQALDAEYLRLRWPGCPLWAIAPLFSGNIKIKAVEVIPGACMLLRRKAFERVGMFSEEYFMYAEDLDLNFKLRDAGFTNYYVGETAIIHHGGRSSSRQRVSQWAVIMKMNAMSLLFQKVRGRWYRNAYRAAMGSVAAARVVVLALMCALGRLFGNRSYRPALDKWCNVLSWAFGRDDLALNR